MTARALRWIGLGAIGVAALVGASALMMDRIAGPLRVEDPLQATPPKLSNWALAVPPGIVSAANPTLATPVWQASPDGLLASIRQIALAEPGVEQLESKDSDVAALVQRSRIMRFPDVISIRALDLGDGRASLAIYSRSVLGQDDFGVNAGRVTRWLAALEATLPSVE